MKIKGGRILILILTIWCLEFDGVSCRTKRCTDAGWFGDDCKYKCRCTESCNNNDGSCLEGGQCQGGWFGPACQYADLVYNKSSNPLLTDGNDFTCTYIKAGQINLKLDESYPFTWLRVKFDDNYEGNFEDLNLWTQSSISSGPTLCLNMKRSQVNKYTVDIHCELDSTITSLTLSFKTRIDICSVYVSGGRNVAIKQLASQSSDYRENSNMTNNKEVVFEASRAIDGNKLQEFFKATCTHTNEVMESPKANWRLNLSMAHEVNRYVIYNRIGNEDRLRGFTLSSFDINGIKRFNFTDTRNQSLLKYSLVSIDVNANISSIVITTNSPDNILTLCEIELYGDSSCPSGKYGRDCEKTCNCADPREKCFVSTGGCTSGCKPGYQGEDCRSACFDNTFGINCRQTCSPFCFKNDKFPVCDRFNGSCLRGCIRGYEAPLCVNVCRKNKFGQDCDEECSSFCKESSDTLQTSCNHINGSCIYGCKRNTFGVQCNQTCSGNCAAGTDYNSVCDRYRGSCLYGCNPGFQDEKCNKVCGRNFFGSNCSQQCSEFCLWEYYYTVVACDRFVGKCTYGCKNGYEGDQCWKI